MNRVEQQLECSTCQWNKQCIEPPSMTKADIERLMGEMQDKAGEDGEKKLMSGLITTMVFGGKDQECHACPVFLEKLRQGPELSAKIKDIMKQN